MVSARRPRRFFQVDVFAPHPGSGNPLAVVFDGEDLGDAQMQAIATWTNLAETTFVLPPTAPEADYRVRIFTTRKEIAFAGHPSIGTAHAVIAAGYATPSEGRLVQECQAGLLPLRISEEKGSSISVRVPRSRIVRYANDGDDLLQRILAGTSAGVTRPALVEGGRRWWLAELAEEAQVRGFHPDAGAIAALAADTDSLGLCIFARCAEATDDTLVVRAFPLGVGIPEDPASGAANAAIAAFLDEAGALDTLGRRYRASQGREIGRDAVLQLRIDEDGEVWVGGENHAVIQARLTW